ncbi:MAG: VWA domain-containing protein [Candidatus Omnitrophica bacterium]|nr:VWA domain-containing protein [Candidatus Omnitrophota bacterium]
MWLAPMVWIAAVAAVLSRSRRIPLSGWRKWTVIGCRVVAVSALCAALLGISRRYRHASPRCLLYLVDASASIDESQRAWIARRIASLEALRHASMERAVVAFGADTRLLVPLGRDPLTDPEAIARQLAQPGVRPDQTNLETGLLSLVGWLPPDRRCGVVLLSDGQETAGHVTRVLAFVRRFGLEVFPAPPPTFSRVHTVWEQLSVPPVVQRGAPVVIQAVVLNGSAHTKSGLMTVALQGVPVKRQRVAVRPGWQVFSLSIPAIGRGTMALEVRLAIPEEGLDETRSAYTDVEGPPKLLLVTDRAGPLPLLAAALKRREIDIALARSDELPTEANRFIDDDAVMLFNLPKSQLSPDRVGALRAYVETLGGGLVTIGLGGDLAHETTTPSPLDPLLPVTFEPKGLQESTRRVCMILLIDRSASMFGPRIAATKRAAVELVTQLAPEDLVGVLAFDTQPYVVAEVQPAGQVTAKLVDTLVRLRSTGGTDVYPALVASAKRLELTGATLKHLILLSDGNTPVEPQAYRALLDSFRLSGTTVTTIGIGAAFVNTEYLEWLAKSTGGTFYPMRNLNELPRLIARDVQQQMGRLPFTEGRFRPTKTPTTDWFAETEDWPALRGYLTATAKSGARVDLTVNGGEGEDPLLARWTVGRGRVVSFLSDAQARWSPEWIRWPGFEGAWAQVVRWAMRPRLTEELFVRIDESGDEPQLILEGVLHDPQATLIAAGSGEAIPLSLVQTGSWRWRATLAQVPSGWHQLALESHPPASPSVGERGAAPDRSTVLATRWVQIGTPPSTKELAGQPPRESVLRQIARSTSGAYDEPDRVLLPPTTTVQGTAPLLAWWLPLAILALLVDVALRGSTML